MIITTKNIKQVTNAKEWPEFYTCNFLEPGLVSYEDAGAGIAMLRKETILKMLPTFMGKPVVINHTDVSPKDFENHAVGYITKVWYDDFANWAYCQFILTDDKAKDKVATGYSVSCAYDNVVTGPGGEKNAIKYDEEIIDGVGNHLALVTSPRYEECKIQPCAMLVNSKKAVMKEGEGKKNIDRKTEGRPEECPSCKKDVIFTPSGQCPECKSYFEDKKINMVKNAETIPLKVQQTSKDHWSLVGVHEKDGGNGAQAILFGTRDEAIEKGRALEKETKDEPRPYKLMSIENATGKSYCGNCGERVDSKNVHDGEFVCPRCHWDSWMSETIPASEFRKTKWPMQDMLAMTPEQKKAVREGKSPGDFLNSVTVKIINKKMNDLSPEEKKKLEEAYADKTVTVRNVSSDQVDAYYAEYIKRWKADGRDVAEALKTRFGLTKSEAKIVMDRFEKANSLQKVGVRVVNAQYKCKGCGHITSSIKMKCSECGGNDFVKT